MAHIEVHQKDGNADELYKAARRLGFSVVLTNRPFDAVFGIYDQSAEVEVKRPGGKLELAQCKWWETSKGCKRIIREVGDVIALYQELRARHDVLWNQRNDPTHTLRRSDAKTAKTEEADTKGGTQADPQAGRKGARRPAPKKAPRAPSAGPTRD